MGEGLEAREGLTLQCLLPQLTQLLPSGRPHGPLEPGGEARRERELGACSKDSGRGDWGFLERPDQVFCPSGSVALAVILTLFFSPSRAAGLELRAGVCAMAPHWAIWLLAVGPWSLGIGAEVWWNLVPRKTVSSGGECLKSEKTDHLEERGQEGLLKEKRRQGVAP